ncbi:hypothetical protein AcV7_003809 [Taiwanofungus camphoratus]|nr:hypothetical protein AcV7_003809 [Antrodia cinnamomea]
MNNFKAPLAHGVHACLVSSCIDLVRNCGSKRYMSAVSRLAFIWSTKALNLNTTIHRRDGQRTWHIIAVNIHQPPTHADTYALAPSPKSLDKLLKKAGNRELSRIKYL